MPLLLKEDDELPLMIEKDDDPLLLQEDKLQLIRDAQPSEAQPSSSLPSFSVYLSKTESVGRSK